MKERQTNIEILRVIAMLMVMTLHTLGAECGGILKQYSFGTVGYAVFWLIESFCFVAVNCYVLITGYFMVSSDFKLSRIIKLMVQVGFYSALGIVIVHFVFQQTVTIKDLVYAVFPLTSYKYWFASCYVILLLLAPFLNWTIRHMTRKELLLTNVVLIVLFCIIPTVFFWSRSWLGKGFNVAWFIVLYFVAGYIRLYGDRLYNGKKVFVWYVIFCAGTYVSRIFIAMMTTGILGKETKAGWLYCYNSISLFPAAVCLFMTFCQLSVKPNKALNVVAKMGALSFGAYLWTEHDLIRKPLWEAVNVSGRYQNNVGKTLVYMIFVAIVLFVIGILIEWMRLKLMTLLRLQRFLKGCDRRFEIAKDNFEQHLDKKMIVNR